MKITPTAIPDVLLMETKVDVVVDIRQSSPTFGQWVGFELSENSNRQTQIPTGFAHVFFVPSDSADSLYKTTNYYAPEFERCIAWNDESIGVQWSLQKLQNEPQLPSKDKAGIASYQAELFL